MTCRQFIEFLIEYISGELTEDQRGVFDRHVAICADCVAYLQNYKAAVQLGKDAFEPLDEPVPPEVPEDLVAAILAARKSA